MCLYVYVFMNLVSEKPLLVSILQYSAKVLDSPRKLYLNYVGVKLILCLLMCIHLAISKHLLQSPQHLQNPFNAPMSFGLNQ